MQLSQKHLERYADVMIWGLELSRSKPFKEKDIIMLRYSQSASALAHLVYEKLLQRGMYPVLRTLLTPDMEKSFYSCSNDSQLEFVPPGEKELCENLNGNILLNAPESITHLKDIDPKKISRSDVSKKYLRDILMKRDQRGEFSWTLCILPTEALAGQAGMTIDEYTAQVVKACFLDREDPVSHWRDVHEKVKNIKEWLTGMDVSYFHIESENIDLQVSPGQNRKWLGVSGHNIPSFEVFVTPDWRHTKGIYYADQPSYRSGNLVRGLRVEFEKGEAVKISAESGEAFALSQIQMDQGASRIGEFSMTDRRLSRIDRFMANTLYDENFGGEYGNCHIALGSSYSDSYNGDLSELTAGRKNRLGFNESALHWDIVNTEKKIVTAHLASGGKTVIYENGEFKY